MREPIKFFRRLALAVMLVCLFLTGQAYVQSFRHKAQQDDLKAMTAAEPEQTRMENDVTSQQAERQEIQETQDSVSDSDLSADDAAGEAQETPEEPVILEEYAKLYEENEDLAGWLSIEGMKIDYPVMQNEDDEYYLHHDFYGEDSKYGCLYVRGEADLDDGTNFVIYGHNMKDGSMFGDLDLYLEEEFYKEHSLLSFNTLYEERSYEIVAVFRSQVYKEEEDVFKYYEFYEADTEEEFADFYDNIKALSLYDTGVEAQFGDTFLTLSTCAYHVKDGRFVVVAKRADQGL